MPLKAVVESLDDVDAGYRGQYKEVKAGDKVSYHLDIEGVDLLPPVRALKDEAAQRRIAERTIKGQLETYTKAFGDRKVEDILSSLDRIPELEASLASGGDPKKLDAIVDARLVAKLAPVQRELATAQAGLKERDDKIAALTSKERTRQLHDAVRDVVKGQQGFQESALEDVFMLAERVFEQNDDGAFSVKDGMGVTPGSNIAGWLAEMQAKRPHWWGPTQGAGFTGGKGNLPGGGTNPWSAAHWNVTEQSKLVVSDRKRAESLAAQAGSKIGAVRPTVVKQ